MHQGEHILNITRWIMDKRRHNGVLQQGGIKRSSNFNSEYLQKMGIVLSKLVLASTQADVFMPIFSVPSLSVIVKFDTVFILVLVKRQEIIIIQPKCQDAVAPGIRISKPSSLKLTSNPNSSNVVLMDDSHSKSLKPSTRRKTIILRCPIPLAAASRSSHF